MTLAEEIARHLNPNALVGFDEDGRVCVIEDVIDPDGRIYRIELQTTADGQHASAFVRHNPWGPAANASEYAASHWSENGLICIGSGATLEYQKSPHTLEFALERARYWCIAHSYYRQHGTFIQP